MIYDIFLGMVLAKHGKSRYNAANKFVVKESDEENE